MSAIPIPQGATIGDSSPIPIPQGAQVESEPGKGLPTDSADPNYQFKNPALSPDEMEQLQKANLSRPLYRKILGLPSSDSNAQALEAKDQAHQTESAQHSGYVQEQLADKAIGGAVVAAAPVVAAGAGAASAAAVPVAKAIGTTAGTAVRLARTPVGQAVLKKGLESAGLGAGYALAKKWLGL